ncbi:helix-turn-helix transcriptional regulator [Streptomyces sp. Z26]|uniref:helix-turn-helix domain-containing protein n=1 Tax=Streptomyces TaxID=1883 RepID=UPI000EF16420|nr:helix-turn-helix transcriptional regulator [Streptomyces sp. Z26]RLL67730.1 XRE family transcriptional regulator [Streptomyces sp. Z26]
MRITRLTHDVSVALPADAGAAGAADGPAIARMTLGERLRRLREAQYITRGEAAEAIRLQQAQLTLMELGRTGFRARDVSDLMTVYGLHDESERATLHALVPQTNVPGWWHPYADVVPRWLSAYLGLEHAAGVIRSYELQFVPGLLQTREYARAVVSLGHAHEPESRLRRRVELRMSRQRVLRRARPPHVWAVVDEAALRRPVGGPEVMRAQLEHLLAACELPHVTLQVLPFGAGGHAAAGGPVTLLRVPQPGLPDVVYLEQLFDAHYPEDPEDIRRYRQVVDRLVTTAEPPTRTPALLREILDDGWS